jgi:hypothetical protein
MAPRIRADRAAAETGKKRARAKAEKAFKTTAYGRDVARTDARHAHALEIVPGAF